MDEGIPLVMGAVVALGAAFFMNQQYDNHKKEEPKLVENWMGMLPMKVQSQTVRTAPDGLHSYADNRKENELYQLPRSFTHASEPRWVSYHDQDKCAPCDASGTNGKERYPPASRTPLAPSSAVRRSEGFVSSPATNPKKEHSSSSSGHFITVPGTYQDMLYERPADVPYGSNITYNLPEEGHLGVPYQKEGYSSLESRTKQVINQLQPHQAKESFTYDSNSPSGQGVEMEKNLAKQGSQRVETVNHMNPNQPLSQLSEGSAIAFSSMSNSSSTSPVVVVDRFYNTLLKSRTYGQGDFIRGDLAIAAVKSIPDPSSMIMFRPTTTPNDLNSGALCVMGGVDNSTANALAVMKMQASGGLNQCHSGVVFNPAPNTPAGKIYHDTVQQTTQMQANKETGYSGTGVGDYSVTANSPALSINATGFIS